MPWPVLPSLRRHWRNYVYRERRRDMAYYALVSVWLSERSPGAFLLDVGSRGTAIIHAGDFSRRIALDIEAISPPPGIEAVRADWLTWQPPSRPDVITCLQVLEHLPDDVVVPFARKLLENADTVMVSVPHNWPSGRTAGHLQDPVTLEKLTRWMGRAPDRHEIITDLGRERLIAEYRRPGLPPLPAPQWPPVTVIVPHYRHERPLRACLEAIKGQDYLGPFNIIVADNSEAASLASLEAEFSGVTFLWEPSPGSYAARNAAIQKAGQGVLAFTDADCRPHPDWLRRGVSHLLTSLAPACVAGYVEVHLSPCRPPGIANRFDLVSAFRQPRKTSTGYAYTANMFTWKHIMNEIGSFDACLLSGGDYEWGRRLLSRGYKIGYERLAVVDHDVRDHQELEQKARRLVGGNAALDPGVRGALRFTLKQLRGLARLWLRILISPTRDIPRRQKPLVALYCLYRCGFSIAYRLMLLICSRPAAR